MRAIARASKRERAAWESLVRTWDMIKRPEPSRSSVARIFRTVRRAYADRARAPAAMWAAGEARHGGSVASRQLRHERHEAIERPSADSGSDDSTAALDLTQQSRPPGLNASVVLAAVGLVSSACEEASMVSTEGVLDRRVSVPNRNEIGIVVKDGTDIGQRPGKHWVYVIRFESGEYGYYDPAVVTFL